jgi:tRNA (adenine37-N6)-methyltransferase
MLYLLSMMGAPVHRRMLATSNQPSKKTDHGERSTLAVDNHSNLLVKRHERATLLSPSEFSLLLHQTRKRQVETMALGSKNTSNTSLTWMALTIVTSSAATALVTAAMGYWYHQQKSHKEELQWEQKRQEERTGRIRAEVKLRKALLQVTNQSRNEPNKGQARKKTIQDVVFDQHAMKISCIGIVQSPYTKRMGTPRQGALVPQSRAIVQFSHDISPELFDGIMEYSHVWIIFAFHDNTNLADSRKTKIRPPRGNGQKVGQLATRSPHRPNPLGLSVVQVESFHPSKRQLHIRGLDLVNGTPVYDIKPYVHWDIVGVDYSAAETISSGVPLKIPDWVERRDDVLAQVEFAPSALVSLRHLVGRDNALAPLYPAKDPTSVLAVQQTLCEILAQDPRSSHKGVTKNQRGATTSSTSNKSHQSHGKKRDNDEEAYRLLFGPTLVEFVVRDDGAHVINMSMAEPIEKATDSTSTTGSPHLINDNEKDGGDEEV